MPSSRALRTDAVDPGNRRTWPQHCEMYRRWLLGGVSQLRSKPFELRSQFQARINELAIGLQWKKAALLSVSASISAT